MARDWEATFSGWTGPASDSEQDRYERTREEINEALASSSALHGYSFEVHAKGSYPNFTNVVADSDVDVAAELTVLYGYQMTHEAQEQGLTLGDVGGTPYTGTYDLPKFKNDVEAALVRKFGAALVHRGNKAIHLRKSSSSLAADVVPCTTHKSFYSRSGQHQGITLQNDQHLNEDIVNYPKQHLKAGTHKNERTQKRYKRVVRILKHLENEMVNKGVISVVPSFLIESAVFNVPDNDFNGPSTWLGRVQNAIVHIYNGTETDACMGSDDWMEANGIKYLFHRDQNWTHQQAREFAFQAWTYADFGS